MSNVILKPAAELAPADFTKEQLDLIKATVAKGATDNELKLFLYRCKNMGLDPLKPGMVHFIKYGSNPGSIVVGIEGFRAKAHRTGKLSGIKRGIMRDGDGRCVGAWCEVKRKDWEDVAREEVSLAEYSTGKAMWAKMPETMIKKVAEAAALRMAFSDELGGVITEEEMRPEKDTRAQEITDELHRNEAVPEFAAENYFEGIGEPEVNPDDPGEFVVTVGSKAFKGKKVKDISPSKLSEFLAYVNSREGLPKEVKDNAEKVKAFLEGYTE